MHLPRRSEPSAQGLPKGPANAGESLQEQARTDRASASEASASGNPQKRASGPRAPDQDQMPGCRAGTAHRADWTDPREIGGKLSYERSRPQFRRAEFTMAFSRTQLFLAALVLAPVLVAANPAGRFVPIFDGVSLKGWDGNPKLWDVEDGAIVGRTSADDPIPANSFLVWRQGELDNFELKFEYMIDGGNSGLQYRAFEKPREWGPHILGGLQADFEAGTQHTGGLYGERSRRILARRGQKVEIGLDGKPDVVGSVGDPADLQALINLDGWNRFHVIARGNRYIHKINGHVMVDVIDNDPDGPTSGLLGLQVHRGPPMTVKFRNIQLKRLEMADKKKVVFIGGVKSHGYGSHEHAAGIKLLMDALNRNFPEIHSVGYFDGYPDDPTALDNADAVVLYSNGGLRHPWLGAIRPMDQLAARGGGIGAIHFAVEVPEGEPGAKLLDWIGGYFEPWWSVNPHWTLEGVELAENHPITNGVEPFELHDEWYFHIRFRPEMHGVTPILQALPPAHTMDRPDGPAFRQPIRSGRSRAARDSNTDVGQRALRGR